MLRAVPAAQVQLSLNVEGVRCDMLSRQGLMSRSRLSAVERVELLGIFIARREWTCLYFTWRPKAPGEAGNHLIELAVAGAAPFITARKLRNLRNLRNLRRAELGFPGLRCLAPAPLLKEIAP